jgi:hypothetical protein
LVVITLQAKAVFIKMLNDSLLPEKKPEQSWSPTEVVKPGNDEQERILGWWYRFTTPPRPLKNANYLERERYRKARLTSSIGFVYLIFLLILLPSILFTAPVVLLAYYTSIVLCFISLVACCLTLILNRAGQITLAGSLLVFIFEISLAVGIIANTPLDTFYLQYYNLFVIGELLAASLLTVRFLFFVAFLNSTFITLDVIYQPHTEILGEVLHKQLALAISVPIIVQVMVAGVIALWVYSSSQANERANRAEMVAALEHAIAQQLEVTSKEKKELEESIQQLVQAHVNATNGRVVARIPYPPAKVLWPLVGVINALWVRLQRAEESEYTLGQLRRAIAQSTERLHQASFSRTRTVQLMQTGTEMDILILAINTLQNRLRRTQTLEP